jgi:transposase
MRMVIPRRRAEHRREPVNKATYRQRNQIERLLNRLRQKRRVAACCEIPPETALATLTVAANMLWL